MKRINEGASNFWTQDDFDMYTIDVDMTPDDETISLEDLEDYGIPYYDVEPEEDDVRDAIERWFEEEWGSNAVEDFSFKINGDNVDIYDIRLTPDYERDLMDDDIANTEYVLSELNDELEVFKIILKDGYYAGIQTYVEPSVEDAIEDTAWNLFNTSYDYEDNAEGEAQAHKDAEELVNKEIDKINKELLPQLKDYGWKKMGVAWGPADNGETGYRYEEGIKEGKNKDGIKSFTYKDYLIEYSPYYNYYIVRKSDGEVLGYINGFDVATGNRKDLYKRIDNKQWEESLKGGRDIKEGFGDEGFFTRDDLIEFENELEDRLGHQSKTRAYIDGNKLSVDYELDGEDYGTPAEVKIDMRKIKNPSKDLIKNYLEPIYQIIMKEYYDDDEEELDEDTVKVRGKWVNKGKEGTHGEFKTKKEADAQRKAMFAGGFKEGMNRLPSKGQKVKLKNGKVVEVYTVYKNAIDYVGKNGRVMVPHGEYTIVD